MKAKDRLIRQEREKLEGERERTLVELNRLREYLKYEVEVSVDEGDPDIYEREKNLALAQSLESKLESIDHALHLLDMGTYGICEKCGERIDPARLEALPDATLCLKCKTKVERLMKRATRI